MTARTWKKLAARLAGVLFDPAPDPTLLPPSDPDADTTAERIEAALATVRSTRRRLRTRSVAVRRRIAGLERQLAATGKGANGNAERDLLRERHRLAVHEERLLAASLAELETEERRLAVVRDRLLMRVETQSLRSEIAAARQSAAEARYDAGGSLLGLSQDFNDIEESLRVAESRAAAVAAHADAIERMLEDRLTFE